jgi:uncharacterized protein (DUF2235 family)
MTKIISALSVRPKRIIFCADGTWDKVRNHTNVHRLFQAITKTPDQLAFYDDGVGTWGPLWRRLLGGAFGDGLFQKIKQGYKTIAQHYQPHDDLFIFGFSRGAYTARSLAGMIAICGLPTADFDDPLVHTAFIAYRQRDPNRRAAILATLDKYQLFDAKIKMLGVWDTVGSLGIPALWGGVDPQVYGFLDTTLHPDVLNAYQALAIDERRREFPPTLWQPPSPPVPDRVLEQVWFCGAHCDIGGGYHPPGLSNLTLSWMIGKAKKLGLQIDPNIWSQSALAPLHNSWNIFWGFPNPRTIPANSVLANTVALRCQSDNSYQPSNLIVNQGILASSYTVAQVVA